MEILRLILVPRKGSKLQKGPNRARMKFSCFLGGDTLKSREQTKFEAKPVEISPFRTEGTVGPQNGPYPKHLFSDGNLKFRRCQSGDIFQAAKFARFQIRPIPGSKVMGILLRAPANFSFLTVYITYIYNI